MEQISPDAFHTDPGLADWRVLFDGAHAHFVCPDFASALVLINAIGVLADGAGHHPDLDLRYRDVIVRLMTHEVHAVTNRDTDLARQISEAAREHGATVRTDDLATVQLTVDALSEEVLPFWRAVLGYELSNDDLVDPLGRRPAITFQQMTEPRPGRNRLHVDVSVPPDQAEKRVAAALAAGGHLVTDRFAPRWWTLADSEGNEVDVASTAGRG